MDEGHVGCLVEDGGETGVAGERQGPAPEPRLPHLHLHLLQEQIKDLNQWQKDPNKSYRRH